MNAVEHISEDDLERYAMRSLPARDSERLEEHLLICHRCQDRLRETDEYVAAMKAAAGKIRQEDQGR